MRAIMWQQESTLSSRRMDLFHVVASYRQSYGVALFSPMVLATTFVRVHATAWYFNFQLFRSHPTLSRPAPTHSLSVAAVEI